MSNAQQLDALETHLLPFPRTASLVTDHSLRVSCEAGVLCVPEALCWWFLVEPLLTWGGRSGGGLFVRTSQRPEDDRVQAPVPRTDETAKRRRNPGCVHWLPVGVGIMGDFDFLSADLNLLSAHCGKGDMGPFSFLKKKML